MAKVEEYVVIPGTQQKVYDGSVVMLYRLPNLRWILHYGYYNYNGKKQKGWYFSSIPSDTTMPVFNEDLVAMKVIDGSVGPHPCPPPYPPFPPGPFPPHPPAPIPIPFTPQDKKELESAMLTVENLTERDKMSSDSLPNGKIVRVNDTDGHGTIEYYSWDSESSSWVEASLGYRYMTREEVLEAVGDDIVDIVWSNENGSLVVTNHAGTPVDPIKLFGVAHDPIYTEEELELRIPIYGKDDFVMSIPRDYYIRAIRFEPNWVFPGPPSKVGPAIVVTVSDGVTTQEIAGDASGMCSMLKVEDTFSIHLSMNGDDCKLTADVKLSSIENNMLKVDNEGMWVDLSGVVGKKNIETGFLLVADGNGEFTYGGNGVGLEQTTAISDLTNPEKKVVTANLIADAISAAVSAVKIALEARIADLETRIGLLEDRLNFEGGENGIVLVTNGDQVDKSEYKIGGGTLDTESTDTIATEEAMTKVLSWQII